MFGHPRKIELSAWFDGEGRDRVGAHVLRCGRCQRHVSELSRLRSWLRAQPFVAMGDAEVEVSAEPSPPGARARHPVMLVTALVAAFVLVSDRAEPRRALHTASPATTAAPAPTPSTTVEDGGLRVADLLPEASEPATAESPPPSAAPSPARSVAGQGLARSREPAGATPLRLGLIVPGAGVMAAEGDEVENVVRQRVSAANAAGGVAGLPVELEVAPAEDAAAVAAMADRVDALVGGFGASPATSTPWLLPADPAIAGPSVVPAEITARVAGAQLGGVLRRQGVNGPVGVVLGSGPDNGLAAGLASKTPTTTVTANEAGTCGPEVSQLARSGAVALAVAGGPDLAAKCLRAAFAMAWRPAFGSVLAPSAAYAGLQSMPEALGARTVLALPWPTSMAPGALRFRSTTQSTSYRALVSYAAAELAIDVARQQGTVSVGSVGAGTWRSDLLDLAGLTSRVGSHVVAFLGTWLLAAG